MTQDLGEAGAGVQPVILCGGSGTRLWPLSRKTWPKQFIPLVQGKSLMRLTVDRLAAAAPGAPLLVVAGEEHRFMVTETLEAAGAEGRVLLEPQGRNTAPAIALAALAAQADDLLLVCPSDHHIPDAAAFARLVEAATPAARAGAIVTFGVVPTFPSTAYGYIEHGEAFAAGGLRVARFVEKPPAEEAARLLLAGGVSWNAGIFFCRAGVMLQALAGLAPDVLEPCRQAMAQATVDGRFVRPAAAAFAAARSQSIDYAVMQKHAGIVVFPFAGAWSDVGSWNAAADLTPADAEGNRVVGAGFAIGCRDTFVHAPGRPVVALGTEGLLIVDTPDALLVAARGRAEEVRDVVATLEAAGHQQAVEHRKVFRPWGWYDGVDGGERFQVKRIYVKPGGALSLQMHHHRAEHWVVVRGTAEVTRGDETFLLGENQSTYIPVGQKHRLRNPGRVGLELIEVQSGGYLGEDDIVRYEDSYGRVG